MAGRRPEVSNTLSQMLDKSTTRQVRVNIPEGLHARPAHALVTLASRFKSEVQVIRNGETVDGKSILSILTLAAGEGTELTLKASGDDSLDALDALESLFLNDFAEEDGSETAPEE